MKKLPMLVLSLLPLTLFLGGCLYMIIDTASPDPRLPSHPVVMHSIGRFMLPVPVGLSLSSSALRLNKITVQEMPWRKGRDREEYFRVVWEPLRAEAHKTYMRRGKIGPSTQGGWAEEDISHLCGYPAMLFCYRGNTADHNIDVHIGLPDVILRLTESRFYRVGEACLDMEAPVLDLLGHYRFGYRKVAPDSFFTAGGRFEGLKTWDERAGIGLKRPASGSRGEVYLRFDTFLENEPGQPPRHIAVTSSLAGRLGIELNILRSRGRELAGMKGLEEVYIMTDTDGENPELTATWEYEGAGGDPLKPRIELQLCCPAEDRVEALRMWDAIMSNFTSAREYYARR